MHPLLVFPVKVSHLYYIDITATWTPALQSCLISCETEMLVKASAVNKYNL